MFAGGSMAGFEEALELHPAPKVLGDVTLRFEPSMLIGETAKSTRGEWATGIWLVGISALLFGVGGLLLSAPEELVACVVAVSAVALAVATWGERHQRAQRRFVANFTTTTLRLDFASPIVGYPRTVLVPFENVLAVELMEQVDGATCLVVDCQRHAQQFREVLVAFITREEQEQSERLARVLRGAFGLGEIPADSPVLLGDISSFTPAPPR